MLDIDANEEADALTEGIVILRYLFGFTGAALVEDAIGSGAIRTDPVQIAAFLDQFLPDVQGVSSTAFAPLGGESVERATPTPEPMPTDAERIDAVCSNSSQDDQWGDANHTRRASLYRTLAYDAVQSRAKMRNQENPDTGEADLLLYKRRW